MSSSKFLRVRQEERDTLLERVARLLKSDERIAAAWLYGSLGRGDGDEWSDVDLWVVVGDDQIAELNETLGTYVAPVGNLMVVVEAPQNAPPGGMFLSVVYGDLKGGPQIIDWSLQPQSAASVPSDALVIFNRGSVPLAEAPQSPLPEESVARAANQTRFFWMMVPVVAKAIGRRQPWMVIYLLALLRYTLDEIRWLQAARGIRPPFPTRSAEPPPVEPRLQIYFLSGMMDEAQTLSDRVEGLEPRVVGQMSALLDMLEAKLDAG
jgi:hypothetical protein